MKVVKCNRCRADIVWVVTVNDKRMPIDAEPSFRGTVVVLDPENDTPLSRVRHKGEPVIKGEPRYTAHFQRCGK